MEIELLRRTAGLVAILALAVLGTPSARAQPPAAPPAGEAGATGIEEEDLGAGELERLDLAEPETTDAELRALFAGAEETFRSADPTASLPGFTRVAEVLDARFENGTLDPEGRRLLARSLSYLAQASFDLGDVEAADAHLRRLIEVAPDFDLDRDTVSPKLTERFDRLRAESTGELQLVVDPPDARVLVDGLEVDPLGGSLRVLAGSRRLEVRRPGYLPVAEEVTVAPGRSLSRSFSLERTSAVLRLRTRPSGAELLLDGTPAGVTEGSAGEDFFPEGQALAHPREEFSEELVIEGLEPGPRVVEIRKDGYRPYRADLNLEDLLDYRLPPIVLDEERGYVVLEGLPAGAQVRLDGVPARVEGASSPRPQLSVDPGEHHLTVSAGPARMFSTRLRVADRQTVEVRVRLLPGLALLGVLGGDQTGAERLRGRLRRGLGESAAWTLIDHEDAAARLLSELAVDAPLLRRLADPETGGAASVDWARVQTALDERVPGLVYVLGVLSDDLVATHADLWVLSAAPGPTRPDRLRLDLEKPSEIGRLQRAFERAPRLRRPWLGMQVVDSAAEPHPVVAHVSTGGPAEAAGLRAGDQVLAVAQVAVQSAAAFTERILAAEPGETLELAVRSPGAARTAELRLGTSPEVLSGEEPDLIEGVVFANLVRLEERQRPEDRWVVDLNQALVLLRTGEWEAAVRRLRAVEVPVGEPFFGRSAVDYWLGLALSAAGARYRETAVASLERAAAAGEDRLFHRDGPWVAPRARARLVTLGAAAGSR